MVNFTRRTVSTLLGCALLTWAWASAQPAPSGSSKQTVIPAALIYENTQFGFCFRLPASWRRYTVLIGQWGGMVMSTSQMIQGPSITIRNSKWTRENPYQDIPILIFKPEVWRKVEDAKITVGAAPFPPSELGRNNRYVFALPARLTSGSANGYQEVSNLTREKPLETPCRSSAALPAK
jgi:bla regulator protein blaR1